MYQFHLLLLSVLAVFPYGHQMVLTMNKKVNCPMAAISVSRKYWIRRFESFFFFWARILVCVVVCRFCIGMILSPRNYLFTLMRIWGKFTSRLQHRVQHVCYYWVYKNRWGSRQDFGRKSDVVLRSTEQGTSVSALLQHLKGLNVFWIIVWLVPPGVLNAALWQACAIAS